MKNKTKKTALFIAFFAIAAFNVIAFTSNAGEIEKTQIYPRSNPEPCYQAIRYCDGWDLTVKCILEETSQLCVRYQCQDCNPN